MIQCPALSGQGPSGIAEALRSIDCQSQQGVEIAFARLFGSGGALSQLLTAALTIYIALLALNLLSGRGSLRLSSLTPRMLHVGLVLTIATSWAAYQTLAWNVVSGAPDEIASALLGTGGGSATQLFAMRLDALFEVIAQSAHLAQAAPQQATVGVVPAVSNISPKPADLLWLSSLLLLLGTVGVLITARIALAAVMGLGPIFIVMALFKGSRGLFEGWLKAALMLSLTPLIAVVIGGATLAMAAPMIQSLANAGGQVPLGLATNIFVAAFVYLSLMGLALRAVSMMTSGWKIWADRDVEDQAAQDRTFINQAGTVPVLGSVAVGVSGAEFSPSAMGDDRVRELVRSIDSNTAPLIANENSAMLDTRRTQIVTLNDAPVPGAVSGNDPRVRSLGQGYRASSRVPS